MELRAGTAVLRRSATGARVGADPTHTLLLEGLSPRELQWLFDTAQAARPQRWSEAVPPVPSPPPGIAHIEERLRRAGLVKEEEPRPVLRILVDGVDSTVLSALTLLADVASVHVDLRDPNPVDRELASYLGADSYGQPRVRACVDLLSQRLPSVMWERLSHPDLALVTRPRVLDQENTHRLVEMDIPHVLLVHDEVTTTIGPLVIPGLTPCAHCWELHMSEADPHHPMDRLELSHWPICPPRTVRRHTSALETARALLAITGHRLLGGQGAETWSHVYKRVDEDGGIRVFHVHPHARCRCGASGIPFPTATAS